MKIYIEIIIFLICILIFIFFKIWESTSKKKLLKKYSIDDDRSKNGELKQRKARESEQGEIIGNEPRPSFESANPIRPTKSEGRSILPKTKTSSNGKNRFSFRKFFKRRNK